MQKKLIALAVGATLAAAPMFVAQAAEVKIGGKLEVELVASEGGEGEGKVDTTKMGDENGMSRINFSVSQDLGNGLKAVALMDWQTNPSDGAKPTDSSLKAREQYVGLAGGFGTVALGRLQTPYKTYGGVKWDPWVATFMQARASGGMSGGATGHQSFVDDVVAYITPDLGGFKATLAYVPDDQGNTACGGCDMGGTWTAGASYTFGPVEVIGAYLGMDGDIELDQAKAGIRYNANGLTAAYQYEDLDSNGGMTINGDKIPGANQAGSQHFFNLGYKFGNTLISGSYGMFSADNDGSDITYGALGLRYYLDKKTSIYGGYRVSDVDDADSYDAIGAGMRFDF